MYVVLQRQYLDSMVFGFLEDIIVPGNYACGDGSGALVDLQ